MQHAKHTVMVLMVGAILGAAASYWFSGGVQETSEVEDSKEKKPLYWVAPMDSNYRRDKPGKSPMGMDLIPVYEEQKSADHGPGAITIAPHVVNNMGVRVEEVEKRVLANFVNTVGYVKYDEDRMLHIHPRVEGWIETLYVKAAGEPVEAGQALYTLYSPQLVNAQEELLISLKRGNQSLIKAAKERLSALQMSDEFVNALQKNMQVQQTVTFYSPQSGVVDGLKIREGFFVKPGTTLMSIAQLQQVWVEAEVFERDAALVKTGLPVTMKLDYFPGRTWQGKVDYVYPSLNEKNRTLRVRLKFDNQDHVLKPNMYVQVAIAQQDQQPVLAVAKEALIRTGEQERVVLDLGEGQFKSVAVTKGRVSSEYIEILSGLDIGDKVVTSAQFLIDSESSKSSDFKRMSSKALPDSVWMEGEVNDVMADHRMVNVSHEPAPEWDWPGMTMDFSVADSVTMDELAPGTQMHFEVTKKGDDYLITQVHIMGQEQKEVSSATVDGTINSIDPDNRTMNISRGPIEKWERPAATMDFLIGEAIDVSEFRKGQSVRFTFEIRDDFVIVEMAVTDQVHQDH